MKSNNIKKNKYKKLSCPNCKSKKIIKWTKRKTENRGLIQRYKCNDCDKTFTINDGFFRMRNYPKKITCALDLFYRGVSTRKVQEHFKAFYPHNSDHTSILRWLRKYSIMIQNSQIIFIPTLDKKYKLMKWSITEGNSIIKKELIKIGL